MVKSSSWAFGCSISGNDTSMIAEAVSNAAEADVAIVFLGIDNSIEAEGQDRYDITLPGVQTELIQQIMAVQKNTIVVLINGGAVAIEWIVENVPGIIEAFYPGENGAQAIAEVLFGIYNPGGKMPYTIYPADYVNQISLEDMHMQPYPGRTYRFYQEQPIFPFGWGLSYTTFEITWENGTNDVISQTGSVDYRATVTNTGTIAGDEVVLAFVGASQQGGAIKSLFGFKRVHLEPGQSTDVYFFCDSKTFSIVDEKGDRWLHPGNYQIWIGNGVKYLEDTVKITGSSKLLKKWKNL